MKTPLNHTASESASSKRSYNAAKFSGAANLRPFRAIDALITRPMPRELASVLLLTRWPV
jgi:hypothetical protein